MGDSLAAKRVDIAVLTFGGQVSTVCEFGTIETVQPPLLIAKGNTPMGEAVERGVVQNGKFKDFGTNTGNSVNRQPKFQIAAIPSYTFRSAWGKARVFGTFTHIGDRFADIENQQRLGSYETVDLGASLDLNDRFSLQATVENLTNKLALTEGNVRTVGSANTDGFFLGRPIFGRHATITAAYRF